LLVKWLAAAHTIFGFALLAVGGWWAFATLQILPHMSTGTIFTNLPMIAMLALTFSAPLVALGVWMMVLGRAVRRRARSVRLRLLQTHGVLLVVSLAAMAVGIADLWAAKRSAQHGGGLLGGLGLIPLGLGGIVGAFDVVALAGAFARLKPSRSVYD
jgi:hypothetical protein